MAHPPPRSAFPSNILNPAVTSTPSPALSHHSTTPGSAGSNNNTFLMSASPVRSRRSAAEGYKPKMISTIGAKPACLVNASVTYVGDDQIYAFGGFDQYTDEVYNHVLRLNLVTRQWNLVDNYGDIPGVRMGHTACLWQGNKLLVFGGENEHRQHLADVIVFDLKTAHWTQPELHGPIPRGRARHSAVIYDDKLYISGGQTGHDSVLDDICYLDLKTWTWSRTWRFVPRINDDMEKSNEIWWLDLRGSPEFEHAMKYGTADRQLTSSRHRYPMPASGQLATGSTGYTANSSVQSYHGMSSSRSPYVAPGSISSLKFHSSPNLPSQAAGTHFHIFSSGCMLDFVTPAELSCETSLSSLELDSLRWQKLAEGKDLYSPNYRWHYCTTNPEGTHAWLLGSPIESANDGNHNGEYLSDVLAIDLRKYGILGNELASDTRSKMMPSSDANVSSHLTGIGADLSLTFDQPPESGSGADFIITADPDDDDYVDVATPDANGASTVVTPVSRPIHVHKLILHARWPHFARLWSAQMAEFHSKKMHIPEPYSAVRAFLFYLYTDSIAPNPQNGPSLSDVAGMLVMSNIYDMPRLRLLCVNRLGRELDIEHAAIIWERAATAGEDWLKQRAATFCMDNFGRIVRTAGYRNLSPASLIELSCEAAPEARIIGGEDLDLLTQVTGRSFHGSSRKRSLGSTGVLTGGEDDEIEEAEDDGMDVN
ncbi:Kelch repeat protein [Pyrenophora tritici-repentis]|nr:Kelch repeat protein [Pyrenophora tritici-repentis]KAI0588632.1 Kelch repeat protein [Pyrenophora tritici-repentis]KAI0588869.1 Kelch repeat protein [Pyrenophora tritici-repentis]KAI0609618.1 Kelch repeat protein [Pyrenophora tritici-repentis]KAI0624706.1 Kelch repeat protein [Pyrenophora tritici-repentis]